MIDAKSIPLSAQPMGGMMIALTSVVTTVPSDTPTITPIASASAFVFVVVMLVVYVIAKLFIKDEPAGPSAEETLLTEIRDELRKRSV